MVKTIRKTGKLTIIGAVKAESPATLVRQGLFSLEILPQAVSGALEMDNITFVFSLEMYLPSSAVSSCNLQLSGSLFLCLSFLCCFLTKVQARAIVTISLLGIKVVLTPDNVTERK